MQQAVVDRDSGVIRWQVGRPEATPVIESLPPEKLALLVKFSDRSVEEAQQARAGFTGVMSTVELEQAESSRARQIIVYPKPLPETEASKARGRSLARALRDKEEARRKAMVQPKVDVASGTITFPKPEAGKPAAAAEPMAYVAIPKAKMAEVAKLAVTDGFKPDAETEKGKANQTAKACRLYVLMAIDKLIAQRASK